MIIPRTIKVGQYSEWVQKGLTDTYWAKEVAKDINRTFAKHPYFSDGVAGQETLNRILLAYTAYNSMVGYCQGMNFVAGFILIMSGGKEEESFWFLVGLLQVHRDMEPFYAGFEGLYQTKFPLLHTFLDFFDTIFHKEFPELA